MRSGTVARKGGEWRKSAPKKWAVSGQKFVSRTEATGSSSALRFLLAGEAGVADFLAGDFLGVSSFKTAALAGDFALSAASPRLPARRPRLPRRVDLPLMSSLAPRVLGRSSLSALAALLEYPMHHLKRERRLEIEVEGRKVQWEVDLKLPSARLLPRPANSTAGSSTHSAPPSEISSFMLQTTRLQASRGRATAKLSSFEAEAGSG